MIKAEVRHTAEEEKYKRGRKDDQDNEEENWM